MEIITKATAKVAGLKVYFTGDPCLRGHVAERRIENSICAECGRLKARQRIKEWTAKNPDRYRAYQKQYRKKNEAKLKAAAAQWRKDCAPAISAKLKQDRLENPEKHRAKHKERYANPVYAEKAKKRAKAWREANPETYNDNNKKWRKENPEKAKSIQRAGWINRRALERAAGRISATDVRTVRAATHCAACKSVHLRMEIDHIVALSRGGTNHISNLQLLCRPCNRSKWAKDQTAWANEKGLTPQNN